MSTPYDIQADGPTRHGPRKRRKVTRSKLGCLTCRKRKKLCDMEHPLCGACSRLGKDCEWPDENSRSASTQEGDPSPHRPQVFPSHMDSSTTVDDFTEIFGGIETMNHIPTPPNPSFFPMFANNMSLDSSFDRSGIGMTPMDMLGDKSLHESNEGHWDASSILDSLFNPNLDEATLQFWTSGCLNQEPQPAHSGDHTPTAMFPPNGPPPSVPITALPTGTEDPSSLDMSEDTLLRYHRKTILSLTSTSDPPDYSDWTTPTTALKQGLRSAIIAFSARHLANKGEVQYEVTSQKKEEQARDALFAKVAEWELGVGLQWDEADKWVLMAGIITLIRLKECRGDVWDYQPLHTAVQALSVAIYSEADRIHVGSKEFNILEKLVHQDVFSSFALLQGPIVTDKTLSDLSESTRQTLTPLLGISFPLLELIKRTIDVVRRRRSLNGKTWDDDEHLDMVQAADDLQDELRDEKKRLDRLTKEHPNLAPHRFLHEALRTACLLLIRGYILSHAPSAIDVGLLVRQNLSLLETMREQKLPGINTTHWVLFVTALNCVPSKNGKNERGRAMQLYEAMTNELSFHHLTRSRRLVEEVWNKNQEGEVLVDWLDILEQWGWEMYFV